MPWSAVASTVLQGVFSHILNKPDPSQPNHGPYRPRPSTTFDHDSTIRSQTTTNEALVRSSTTCINCSSSKASRPSILTEGVDSRTEGKTNKGCFIQVPDSGNFDIRIRRTEAQFSNLKIQSSKGPPKNNAQKSSGPSFPQKKQYEQVRHPHNKQPNAGFKMQNGQKTNVGKKNFASRGNGNNAHGVSKPKGGNLPNNQSTWMYLGRLKVGTTQTDIKSYLTEMFPGRQFKVELLPLYKDAKLPCFKVLVDNGVLDDFQNLNHWPAGVKIMKYIHNFKS